MPVENLTVSIDIRQIPEFPGYGVSLAGCQATIWTRWDNKLRTWTGVWRPMSTWIDQRGHVQVQLARNGKRVCTGVHRLVLMAFVGPCPEGMEACHGNDSPADNRLVNLRWDTMSNNLQDRAKNSKVTEWSGNAKYSVPKLNDLKIREIRGLIADGLKQRDIARRYGVTPMLITKIKLKQIWAHVQ